MEYGRAPIRRAVEHIPESTEYLIAGLDLVTYGNYSDYRNASGESHFELIAALRDWWPGHRVAVGRYPEWSEDTENVISAYVPDKAYVGQLKAGKWYDTLTDVVAISICDFEIWPDAAQKAQGLAPVPMLSRWNMAERGSGNAGLLQVQYAFLELPPCSTEEPPPSASLFSPRSAAVLRSITRRGSVAPCPPRA